MTDFEKIKTFISSIAYKKEGEALRHASFPFVTISRQAGAGGNSLAEGILNELKRHSSPALQGWQRFNQELCKKVAQEAGLKVPLEPLLKFESRSAIEDMLEEMMTGKTPQEVVNKKIFQLLRGLAVNGKVILIGRGGACLTRDLPFGVHIRLVASLEARIKRMVDLLELSYPKAKELVLEQDKSRERLVKTYFNRDVEDPLLYHAVWNTGLVSMKQIARSVVLMIEEKVSLMTEQKKAERISV